jgi:hypothetical protein
MAWWSRRNMPDGRFQKLLDASIALLNSRYRDGEVDAVAMTKFAVVVQEVDPGSQLLADHADHKLVVEHPNDETFFPRRGCVTCDVWLDPVRLRRP